jgi:phospholipid/cholesterol/gamma-HCH transport system substrate-binding protein
MDEKILQLRVGIFVVMAFAILFFLIWLTSESWKGKYVIYIKPTSAPGVTKDTPVRKNGILIGRVSAVQTQDDHVILTLRIDDDEPIYEKEIASIGTDSLLGDAVIEILPLPGDKRGNRLHDGDLLSHVVIKRNPMEIVDVALNLETQIADTLFAVRRAGETIEMTGVDVGELSRTIQEAFRDDDSDLKQLIAELRETTRKAQGAFDNFDKIFDNINEIIGDPANKDRISEVLASLPELFEELQGAVQDTREAVTSLQKTSETANINLQNLQPVTETLRSDGPDILRKVNRSLDNVDGLFGQLGKASESLKKLQSSEGTIGKLLNDPELYQTALETMQNVRDLSIKLEPMLNDLRMFADSIARDPGQLGVRGAVRNRDAKGTGYKGTTVGRERVERY